MECEDRGVEYINPKNKFFNDKLERSFKTYAAEIKANLERGSAI